VIVFILSSDPVYSTGSFVFYFQFDLIVALSCVILLFVCLLRVFIYVIFVP
jgi:hypothetical protein